MRVRHAALAASIGVVLAFPALASSAGTLDQSDTNEICCSGSNISTTFTEAQTFTAGLTGELDEADITLSNNSGSVTVAIEGLTAGFPDPTKVLASRTLSLSGLPFLGQPPVFTPFVFATGAPVTAGTQYAIVASTSSAGSFAWNVDNSGSYPGGSEMFSIGGVFWTPSSNDFGFRTYVSQGTTSVATVPNVSHVGYCSAPGDTWSDGTPIPAGTFLNLDQGQPSTDTRFKGAVAAAYFQGIGISCDNPPAGYEDTGSKVDGTGSPGSAAIYEYWAKT
ncbi:MAG TPA: hypothetical protein VFW85_03635 [Gaiellaceae bacterium]|nr:hypothetical protein [Gaiellaceae bacterium]